MNLVLDQPDATPEPEPEPPPAKTLVERRKARQSKVILMTEFSLRRPQGRRTCRNACATALALMLFAVADARAQSSASGVPNAMQGFATNRDQPIQIEAASLEVKDKSKEATFAGNVKVIQGDTTMTSKTLVVFYEEKAPPPSSPQPGTKQKAAPAKGAPMQSAQPGPGGSSSIKRLEARGNVIVTQKDQVVTGETAIFDTKANLMTMQGGVVLTQCSNVLKGRPADGGHDDRGVASRIRHPARCRACSPRAARAAPAAPRRRPPARPVPPAAPPGLPSLLLG